MSLEVYGGQESGVHKKESRLPVPVVPRLSLVGVKGKDYGLGVLDTRICFTKTKILSFELHRTIDRYSLVLSCRCYFCQISRT